MKELFTTLFSEIGHKLAMLLLVGTTTITTGTAVYKLSTKPPKTVALENQATNSAEVESENTIEFKSTPTLTPTPIRPTTTPSPRITPKPIISIGLKANISAGTQIDDDDDDDKEEFEDEDEKEQETREREDSGNEDRYVNSTNIEIKNEQED